MDNSEKREKLVELILKLIQLEYEEFEEPVVLDEITRLSPDPSWSDYVFHDRQYDGISDEEFVPIVVDRIMSYKPITL